MKLGKFLLCALLLYFGTVNAKEIAITFDDSPRHATGLLSGPERAKKLIEVLKYYKVPKVTFFANSGKLDAEGIARMQAYNNAGHIIANHTHSHPDFNKLTLSEYSEDVLKADKQLRQFSQFKKYFRFPYLREGDTVEKRDGMRELLSQNGYTNAYITLNNYDWYIENIFQQALNEGKAIDFGLMKDFYVSVLMESIEYYDDMAIKALGRTPKHVLLLHEMDISALFIGELVAELRRKGWKIITLEDALSDDIATYQTDKVYRFNPGRIGEIVKDSGKKKRLWHETLSEKYLDKRFQEEVINPSSKKTSKLISKQTD